MDAGLQIEQDNQHGKKGVASHTSSTDAARSHYCQCSDYLALHIAGSGAEGRAVLDIEGLWHPCAVSRAAGDAIVPNDLALGAKTDAG